MFLPLFASLNPGMCWGGRRIPRPISMKTTGRLSRGDSRHTVGPTAQFLKVWEQFRSYTQMHAHTWSNAHRRSTVCTTSQNIHCWTFSRKMNYPTGAEAAEAFTVEAQQLCKAEANDYLNTCCVTPCTSQGVWNGAKGKTKTKLQLHLSNR